MRRSGALLQPACAPPGSGARLETCRSPPTRPPWGLGPCAALLVRWGGIYQAGETIWRPPRCRVGPGTAQVPLLLPPQGGCLIPQAAPNQPLTICQSLPSPHAADRTAGQAPAPDAAQGAEPPPLAGPTGCCTAAQAGQLTASLQRRLPPADIIALDHGYLVVHRRPQQQGSAAQRTQPSAAAPAVAPAAAPALPLGLSAQWAARYQAQLRHLRRLVYLRLLLHRRVAESRFCAVVAASAACRPTVAW